MFHSDRTAGTKGLLGCFLSLVQRCSKFPTVTLMQWWLEQLDRQVKRDMQEGEIKGVDLDGSHERI